MSSNDIKDYYYILGLRKNASKDEIKSAYRKLSIKFHPDKNNGDKFFEERFKDIHEAYETLADDVKRKTYDDRLNANRDTSSSKGARPDAASPQTSIRKKKRSTLYTIIAGLFFLLPVGIKIAVNKINEDEREKKYKALLQETSKPDPGTTTYNPNDSVRLLKVYEDTTALPARTAIIINHDLKMMMA